MSKNIHYVKIKKNKIDKCNICGNVTKLSWDHVPPKKCIIFDDIEIKSIFNKYQESGYPRELSQNGTKFRTICSSCNNRLGTKFDADFNRFISDLAISTTQLQKNDKFISIKVNPTVILKSLFGHLLAAKWDYEETTADESMREFVLNDDLLIPDLNVFYWYFPYAHIELLRDFSRCELGGGRVDFFSMLKMYPIAFFITDSDEFYGLSNFKNHCEEALNQSIDFFIDASTIRTSDWPSLVDNQTALMGGNSANSAIVSVPRLKKRK